MLTEPPNQLACIPLVDEDQIHTIEGAVDIERVCVPDWMKRRKGLTGVVQDLVAVIGDCVRHTPAVLRLEHQHLVPARLQFAGNPPEEVRVAVIPVR
jgi:hypothetical protein